MCFAPVPACVVELPSLPLVPVAPVVPVAPEDAFEACVAFALSLPFAALASFDAELADEPPSLCAVLEDDALALDCADCAACCWAFMLCWSVCENGVTAGELAPEPVLPDERPGVPERDPRREMGDMALPFCVQRDSASIAPAGRFDSCSVQVFVPHA